MWMSLFSVGKYEALVQVAVLDTVPAAAVEMTLSAVFTGRGADDLRCSEKVRPSAGLPYWPLPYQPRICMTGKTIDVFRIADIFGSLPASQP